jgi:hypothetical protein
MRTLGLNIGRAQEDGSWWLVLADNDSNDKWPIAEFVDEKAMEAFSLYMQTQGYAALKLPSEDELNELFE